MGQVCDNSLHSADIEEASHRHDYNVRSQNIIAAMIGFPSMRKAKLALDRYKETRKRSDKKRFEMHKKKYVAHKVLFDLLEGDIMEAYDAVSSASANPEELANPKAILKGWQQLFFDNGHGMITPRTTQVGTRKINSMGGLVKRIMKKRDYLVSKGGDIPKYIIAIAPPQLVASWADRYGVLSPIIERVLRQSDTNVQQTSKYSEQYSDAAAAANTVFSILTDNVLDINNGAMSYTYFDEETQLMKRTGLKGIRLVARKTKGWTKDMLQMDEYGIGSKVIITGSKKHNGVFGYMFVKEDDQGADPKWLPPDRFDKNEEDMKEMLINKYKHEFLYELGSGQARYVVPKVIDLTMDPDRPEFIKDNEIGKDLKAIKQKLHLMAAAAKIAKETGVTTRVPGVHTQSYVDPSGVTWEYRYVMIKQGEGNVKGEHYNLYLIDKAVTEGIGGKRLEGGEQVNFIGNTITALGDNFIEKSKASYTAEELNAVIGGEGFFKSDSYNDFGQYTNKEGDPIYGTQRKQFTSFQRMKVQPHTEAINTVWELLSNVRSIYNQIWAETSVMVEATEAERQKWDREVRSQLARNGYTEEEITEYFDSIYNAGGIEHNLIRDVETGELRMPHVFAMPKAENYMPSLYGKNNIMLKQIPLQIDRLKAKILEFENANIDGKDEELNKITARYEEGLDHLQSIYRQYTEDDLPDHNVFDLNRVHALKHITAWTNPLEVRKDEWVMSDYLNNIYSSINRNKTTVEMLKALHNGNKIDSATVKGEGMLNGAMDYMVNRVKIAYGDTSSRAMTMFGNERSYDTFAENLNGLPSNITGGVKWDGKAAERLTKWITAPMTMIHLGGSAAVVNNTQFVNRFIKVGWAGTRDADKLFNAKGKEGEMWRRIVEHTGVLNILSVFEDIMLKDGNPEWNDAGVVNVGGFPVPTRNLVHFIRLLWKGRDSFVEGGKGHQETDEFLAMIEHRNQGKSRADIQDLRDANDLLRDISESDLKRKRGEYYDIWRLEEGTSEAVIKKRYKQLLGDIADTQLKKMVSWKLGWWFEGFGPIAGGKAIFTFTETERRLRAMTAVSAILEAKRNGLLGKGTDEEIYFSDAAIKVARNAVYAEQFGMTPPHMGELFNGFGRSVWQYKQYPTNQIIHDYRTWKRFSDGNHDWIDGIDRITKALVFNAINPTDTTSEEHDQEAIQMGRFLFTRAMASTLGTMASTVPYLNYIIRKGTGTDIASMLKGGENPVVGTTLRVMLFATLYGMGKDDEKDREEALKPFQYLLLPVLIGTLIRYIDSSIQWFDDD